MTPFRAPLRLIRNNLAGLESPSRRSRLRRAIFAARFVRARKLGKAVQIGHGPATVIGIALFLEWRTESQNTVPHQSKLTLSARESVASRLALFARLFYFLGEELEFLSKSTVAGAVLAMVACSATSVAAPALAAETHQNALANPAPARATKIFTDDSGSRVAIPVSVQRIVTLAPNLTETVYALGLEEKLAADTTYCDTPAAAKDKPHVGGPANPSLEAIVAVHPDLVLATTMTSRETIDALRKLGVAVYSPIRTRSAEC